MPKISSQWPLNFKALQLNACTWNAGDCQNLQACAFIVFSADILTVIDLTVLTSQLWQLPVPLSPANNSRIFSCIP